MDSIKFTCVYCGAVFIGILLTATLGVIATRVWEAEDEEDRFLREVSAIRVAWIISCMINGGFLAYVMSIME